MTPSQILQAARALIEAGWCRGIYSIGEERYCVVGALKAVHRDHDLPVGVLLLAARALTDALPTQCGPRTWCRLVAFNDDPRTTKRRVLALFDRALIEVTK